MVRSMVWVWVMAVLAAACASEDARPGPSGSTAMPPEMQVDPADIIFDTFDGGSLPLSEASEADVTRLLDAIPPIDEPRYQVGADADWLAADDAVVGWQAADGSTWAYPHRVLDLHEVVADEVAGQPILVTYCPLCRSGVVYDRVLTVDGVERELTFGNTSALYQNDLVMVDRQTGSYWWQVAGRAIRGGLTGAELAVLPARTAPWAQWLADHPDTKVLADDQGFGRDYLADRFLGYADAVDRGRTPFPVDPEFFDDDRLSPATVIIGFEVDGRAVAVPAVGPDPVVSVPIDGVEYQVRRADGSSAVWRVDDEGAEPYPSRSMFWFAYLGAFDQAEVPTG